MEGYDFFAAGPAAPASLPAGPVVPGSLPPGPVVPGSLPPGPVASASPPAPVRATPVSPLPVTTTRPDVRAPRWVAVLALLLLAAVAGLGYAVWPHSSGPGRPDPGTARVFGQQVRVELPAPVTADECAQAVLAFHAIAADPRARAAFIAGCTSG